MMYKSIKLGSISTSKVEIVDIVKAWLVISLTFTFLFTNTRLIDNTLNFARLETLSFWFMFGISLLTVGIGFLLHELAHKIAAQRFGCMAEFRAFDQMLFLALGLAAVIGFTFIAPGAVMISGMITRRENGIISLAGPLTNYVLGLLFLGLMFLLPITITIFGRITNIWGIGFSINLWLGLFNMIPFLNFDGAKIMHWNTFIWLGMVAFGVVFLFFLPF